MSEKRLIAVTEEEVERLRRAADFLLDRGANTPFVANLIALADRFSDGITEETAARLVGECHPIAEDGGSEEQHLHFAEETFPDLCAAFHFAFSTQPITEPSP